MTAAVSSVEPYAADGLLPAAAVASFCPTTSLPGTRMVDEYAKILEGEECNIAWCGNGFVELHDIGCDNSGAPWCCMDFAAEILPSRCLLRHRSFRIFPQLTKGAAMNKESRFVEALDLVQAS
jgi:hypothetical protein